MGFPLCTADATNVDTPVESDSIFCIQAEIRAIKEYLRDYGASNIPAGTYTNYLGITPPPGWVFAAQEVSRVDYADIFNLIGTSYGIGDGSTTFDLPNLFDVSGAAVNTTYTDTPVAVTGSTINELPDGRLVLIGGFDGSTYKSSVYFGTISGSGESLTITWVAGTSMPGTRSNHGTFITSEGNIIVIGGLSSTAVNSSAIYFGVITGNTIVWTTSTATYTLGTYGTYVKGQNGENYNFCFGSNSVVSIYETTGIMRLRGTSISINKRYVGACKLADYLCLVVGGMNADDSSYSAECYFASMPTIGTVVTFTATSSLPVAMAFINLFRLADGRVLAIGLRTGGATLGIFMGTINGSSINWVDVTTDLAAFLSDVPARLSCTQLVSGAIMHAGGHTPAITYMDAVKSWRPSRVIIKT